MSRTPQNSPRRNRLLKTIVWVVGVLVAAAIGVFVSPPLEEFRDSLFRSRQDEELVTKIALEQPEATVRDLLGASSYERELLDTGTVSWNEIGWARNGWLVTGIFNADNQLRAFSVVSCDPGFTPTFTPARSEPVTLQVQTLDAIEPAPVLIYVHQRPPSAADVLIEDHASFTVGISSVCGDTDFAGTGDESSMFVGTALEVSDDVAAFRSTTKPNFYAEQSDLINRDRIGSFIIDLGDDGTYEHLQTQDTPSLTQVPDAVVAELHR